MVANFHRRTANGRPYGSVILERHIIVGASIARPSAAAEMQFAFRTECIVFASARPVTMALVYFALACCFTLLQIFTGGRPMAAPTAARYYNTSSVGGADG